MKIEYHNIKFLFCIYYLVTLMVLIILFRVLRWRLSICLAGHYVFSPLWGRLTKSVSTNINHTNDLSCKKLSTLARVQKVCFMHFIFILSGSTSLNVAFTAVPSTRTHTVPERPSNLTS